jgi:hypothetical protein
MSRSTALPVLLCALWLGVAPPGRAQPRGAACCTVTTLNTGTGVATGTVTATGYVFEFKARNPASLGSLRVGQAVHANFTNNQVSLDGRTVWGTVTRAPAPRVTVRQPAPQPTRQPAPQPTRTSGAAGRGPVTTAASVANLPQVTYGEPIPATGSGVRRTGKLARRVASYTVSARLQGRNLSAQLLHLNGRQAIDNNTSLPDGARRLLGMHVRKLALHESQYYIVHPQLAAQWAATHPIPPDIKPKEANDDDSDCGTVSINGIVDCLGDAAQAVEDEFERARKQAEEWWDEATDKLNEAAGCFKDHTLPGPRTPVRFSITPSMTVNMQQSGASGSAKETLAGSVTLGFPIESDFQAKMEFFYIPCLPFVFRPKSLTADGSLTVGNQIGVDVSASGSFDKTFTVPPTGGPQIPLYVIPIVIGDVPVAVIDVSAYIEGDVRVIGSGKASGGFGVTNSHRSRFEFTCSGSGCSGQEKGSTAPTTTNQSAQIEGEVQVKPGIFTALQLSFDYNILQGRAGPEPYLLGIANGCGAVSATQTAGGPSTSQTNAALVADLDWGLMLRAEALAGGQRIGERWEYNGLMRDKHLWFRDVAPGGSTALAPSVTRPAQFTAAQPAVVKVRMPSCYPYTDKVQYRLTWDGGATLAAPGNACTWQSGSGTCAFDPTKDLTLSVTWPNAGAFNLSIQLVEDAHPRKFLPAPQPTRLSVNVGAAASQP